ncbi:MAG TPA: PorP/SprF family type IX secretion system membrane protein [Bacteroidia bacterium]
MKKIGYILMFCVFASFVQAQQVAMYNHYFYKPLFYNPAFSGNNESAEAMLLNRSQWAGFNNGPQLNIFMADGSIKDKKSGVGVILISDKRGINKRTGGNLSYSYRANIKDDIYLLFGLAAGVVSHGIDYSKAVSESGADPTLFYTQQQKTTFDGNAGIAFMCKGLEIAGSAPQLFGNKVNFVDDSVGVRSFYAQSRHYMASIKYNIPLSKDKGLYLAPQGLVRIVPNTPLQYDANLNLEWRNKFWLGGTYKSNYAVSVNAGVCVYKQFNIGYSYEFITGNLANYSGISHEIMVNFKFGKTRKHDDLDTAGTAARLAKDEMYEHKLDSMNNELSDNQGKINDNRQKIQELTSKLEQMKAQQQAMQQQMANNQQNNGNSSGNINQDNNSQANLANNAANNNQKDPSNQANNNSKANNNQKDPSNSVNSNSNNNSANTNNNGSSGNAAVGFKSSKENNVLVITNSTADYSNPTGKSVKPGIYLIVGTFIYEDFARNEVKRFKNAGYGQSSVLFSKSKQMNYVYVKKYNSKEEAVKGISALQSMGVYDAWVKVLE